MRYNLTGQYEYLKIARWLYALAKDLRSQISEVEIDEKKRYNVTIEGKWILAMFAKSNKYFKIGRSLNKAGY